MLVSVYALLLLY